MEEKYKKFIDNGNGDCIYCFERHYDCCCGENSAESLGYHYDHIITTRKLERPPTPEGLNLHETLLFLAANPTSKKVQTGVWRKGRQWFKNVNDLVDYHNHTEV